MLMPLHVLSLQSSKGSFYSSVWPHADPRPEIKTSELLWVTRAQHSTRGWRQLFRCCLITFFSQGARLRHILPVYCFLDIPITAQSELFYRTSERLQRGSVMFGRLDLENPKKNGGDRVLEEFAQDRRYLQVNTRGESCH